MVLQFVRTLIARQALIDELEMEAMQRPSRDECSSATLEACQLSVDTVKTYSRLRHLGLLRFCGFHAVSHVTAAAHTLIACMMRSFDLAFEHRPDLLNAIDILLVFSTPYPSIETVVQLLSHLSRTLDRDYGSDSKSEAVAIRVLASKLARPPSRREPSPPRPDLLWQSSQSDIAQSQHLGDISRRAAFETGLPTTTSYTQSFGSSTGISSAPRTGPAALSSNTDPLTWTPSTGFLETQWTYDASDNAVWGDSFSFLNDGLFNKL
jgi:hypothetical protein